MIYKDVLGLAGLVKPKGSLGDYSRLKSHKVVLDRKYVRAEP